MLTDAQRDEAADALYQAEIDHKPIPLFTSTYSDIEVADAYAIAQRVTERHVANGAVIKGHKIGLTSKAMRESALADEPDYGTLLDGRFLAEGSVVEWSTMFRPLVEIEIAFVMKERLAGPRVNAVDVIRATDFILPAIEIVDSRFTERVQLLDTIADAASFGFIVLGGNPRRLTDIDIRTIGGTLTINGEISQTGVTSAVMGNPINAVAWLANKLAEFDTVIEPGQVVLSGSFIRAEPFEAGDSISARFEQLGDVTVAVR